MADPPIPVPDEERFARLGRLPAPDTRDKRFLMRSAVPRPRQIAPYRNWYPSTVLDQGWTSSCVGHAWRSFMDSSPVRTKGGIGAMQIYEQAQRVDEWPGEDYDGTSVRAGAKVLTSLGHLQQYLWAFTVNDMVAWILNGEPGRGGPVVMGTTWYEGMFYPDRHGRVKPTGGEVGGHAYLVYGYNSRTKLFRAQNSWGRGWGNKGRFTIHYDDMRILMDQWGEACTAVEKPVATTSTVAPEVAPAQPARASDPDGRGRPLS